MDVGRIRCSHPDCTNSYKNHAWGKTLAHTLGWFFQRNGVVWCPDHVPEWVDNWRSKKEK